MASDPFWERESRLMRATREVLEGYEFEAIDENTTRLVGGGSPWEVTIDPVWKDAPQCTCPDHAKARNRGYCKHVIAVLLRSDEHRGQLLELFL